MPQSGDEGWKVIKIQVQKMDENVSGVKSTFPESMDNLEETFLKHQEMFRVRAEAMKKQFTSRMGFSQTSQAFFCDNISTKRDPQQRVSASLETKKSSSVRRSTEDGGENLSSSTTIEIKRTSEEHPNIVTCIKTNQNIIRDRNVMTECVGHVEEKGKFVFSDEDVDENAIFLPKESLDFSCPSSLSENEHAKIFNIPILRVGPTPTESGRIIDIKFHEAPVKIEEVKTDNPESDCFQLPIKYMTSTLKSEQHQTEAYCTTPTLYQRTVEMSSDDDEILEALKESDSSANTYRSSKISRNLIPIEVRREKKGSPKLKVEEKVIEDLVVEEYETPLEDCLASSRADIEKNAFEEVFGNPGEDLNKEQTSKDEEQAKVYDDLLTEKLGEFQESRDLSSFEIIENQSVDESIPKFNLNFGQPYLDVDKVSFANIFMTELQQPQTSDEKDVLDFTEIQTVDPEVKTATIYSRKTKSDEGRKNIYFFELAWGQIL